MKEKVLDFLICPSCKRKLIIQSFVCERSEVESGLLTCSGGHWYPIIHFIPRLLLGEFRGDYKSFLKRHGLSSLKEKVCGMKTPHKSRLQVQKSFGSKWKAQPSWGTKGQPQSFMRKWLLDKYGWGDEETFGRSLNKRKWILDAGTGVGRELSNLCESSKRGEVFGVDISDSVEAAYQNTIKYRNAHVIQADVMNLPFKFNMFDFILSEGVLHHTPDTRRAFKCLLNYLTPKGEIAIYIYVKKGPIREFCDTYLREISTQLSERKCWEFSKRMTRFGKTLSRLPVEFELVDDIPALGMKAGRYNLQRFFYYHVFKCFWNEQFTFDENNLVNFDWYHPAFAHRHTPEEVRLWFKKGGLKLLHFDVSESGITARGQKAL